MGETPRTPRALPSRDAGVEDSFVWALLEEDPPVDEVLALVTLALAQNRPQLAARLVGLLPDDVPEIDGDADVQRARAAARFLLQTPADHAAWSEELTRVWAAFRERRLRRRERLDLGGFWNDDPFRRGRRRR